jgi:hypothetical protein
LIQRKARLGGWRWHLPIKIDGEHNDLRHHHGCHRGNSDATLAIVLGWADRQTNGRANKN